MADLANLVVAAADLSVVKLLRAAIRNANEVGAATAPPDSVYAQRAGDRYERYDDRCDCNATYASDGFTLSGANYNDRPVGVAAPRPATAIDPTRVALQDLAADRIDQRTADGAAPTPTSPPLYQPPWRTVPWNEPMPPRKIVKVVVRPPDIVRSGRLIDFYS